MKTKRPIKRYKFRAWDKKKKSMYLVKELSFLESGFLVFVNVKYQGSRRTQVIEDTDCELMQFTGLLDKNGKEIYEGDILESHSWFGKGEVIFQDGCFRLRSLEKKTKDGIFHFGRWFIRNNKLKVIGNIFENKALLDL